MEHNIEVVDGKTYKAIEPEIAGKCTGCAFDGVACFRPGYPDCDSVDRDDKTDVIYKLIPTKEATK